MAGHLRLAAFVWLVGMVAVAPPAAGDVSAVCDAYASADAVFIGRAGPPQKRWLTFDFGVDDARRRAAQADADYNRHRSLDDPSTKARGDLDLLTKKMQAKATLAQALADTLPPVEMTFVPLTVEAAFRGVTAAVVFLAPPRPGEPGSALEPGRAYLVYGFSPFPHPPVASLEVVRALHPIQDLEAAAEDLQFLYSVAARGVTVSGALALEHPYDPHLRSSPLGGVPLRLSSADSVIDVITGSDGTFRVTGLAAGPAEITSVLPDSLVILPSYSQRHTLPDGGCITWHLKARLNGRVRGQALRENGSPLAHVDVDLVPVDDQRARMAATLSYGTTRTNDRGEFAFAGQPPGAYWLGVNLRHPPTSRVPYPRRYFPGTTNRDEAQPIVIGQGTEHDGFIFSVKAPLPHGRFELHIETGGQPQTALYACVSPPAPSLTKSRLGGSAGQPFLLDVVEGEEYRLSLHADTPAGHFHSDLITLIGAGGRTAQTVPGTRATAVHAAGPCF